MTPELNIQPGGHHPRRQEGAGHADRGLLGGGRRPVRPGLDRLQEVVSRLAGDACRVPRQPRPERGESRAGHPDRECHRLDRVAARRAATRSSCSTAVAFSEDGILALGPAAGRSRPTSSSTRQAASSAPGFRDGHVHSIAGRIRDAAGAGARPRDAAGSRGRCRGVGREPSRCRVGSRRGLRPHPGARRASSSPSGSTSTCPDRPVVLRATDYHTVWVNSEALRRAGYTASTPQPHDGEIVRDADGESRPERCASGAHGGLSTRCMPPMTEEQGLAALGRRVGELLVGRARPGSRTPGSSRATSTSGSRPRRPASSPSVPTSACGATRTAGATSWRTSSRPGSASPLAAPGRLTATTVKFFADGVIESGTGAMLEPYCDCPHSTGLPNWDPRELNAAVAAVDALGFSPHIHAIGDAAARMALDAIEHANAVNGATGPSGGDRAHADRRSRRHRPVRRAGHHRQLRAVLGEVRLLADRAHRPAARQGAHGPPVPDPDDPGRPAPRSRSGATGR